MVLVSFAADAKSVLAPNPCNEVNAAGTWKLVTLVETPPGEQMQLLDQWPHQYIQFDAGGAFSYVSGAQPAQSAEALARALASAVLAGDFTAVFDGQGIMDLHRDGKPWERFYCYLSNGHSSGEKPGDMIWSNGPQNTNGMLYKLYRKLDAAGGTP